MADQILPPDSRIRVFEGAKNNLPDGAALDTARAICGLVSGLDEKDLLFVLVITVVEELTAKGASTGLQAGGPTKV